MRRRTSLQPYTDQENARCVPRCMRHAGPPCNSISSRVDTARLCTQYSSSPVRSLAGSASGVASRHVLLSYSCNCCTVLYARFRLNGPERGGPRAGARRVCLRYLSVVSALPEVAYCTRVLYPDEPPSRVSWSAGVRRVRSPTTVSAVLGFSPCAMRPCMRRAVAPGSLTPLRWGRPHSHLSPRDARASSPSRRGACPRRPRSCHRRPRAAAAAAASPTPWPAAACPPSPRSR